MIWLGLWDTSFELQEFPLNLRFQNFKKIDNFCEKAKSYHFGDFAHVKKLRGSYAEIGFTLR